MELVVSPSRRRAAKPRMVSERNLGVDLSIRPAGSRRRRRRQPRGPQRVAMSHILAQWLNEEVHLSRPVAPLELDQACSSGYILGELLHRYNLQDDFPQKFKDTDSSEQSVQNYIVLERTLKDKLGISISSNQAFDLIKGKRGSAANLLYQIKSALYSQKNPREPKGFPGLPKRKESFGFTRHTPRDETHFRSYPSSPKALSPIPDVSTLSTDPKQRFNEKEHAFFAETLRSKLRRSDHPAYKPLEHDKLLVPKHLVQAVPLNTVPASNKLPQLPKAVDFQHNDPLEEVESEVDDHRPRADELSARRPTHAESRKTEVRKRKQERQRKTTITKFKWEVNNFEERLTNFVHDATRGSEEDLSSAPETVQKFVALKAPMDPLNHLKMLSRSLPTSEERSEQSHEYLEKIRLRKLEDVVSKREREQRRRKRALEEQRAQEEADKAHLEQMALSKLLRQSKQERRIAEQLIHVRHEREVMRENRVFRERQYERRRQEDYENALAREYHECEKAREMYKRQTALQLAQHRELLAQKAAEKHQRRYMACQDIVDDIFNLSVRISEYRTLNDGKDLPKKLLNEWKILFTDGAPMTKQYNKDLRQDAVDSSALETRAADDSDGAQTDDSLAVTNGIKLLDDKEFNDYLTGKGDWGFSEHSQESPVNDVLAKLVDAVLDITAPPEPVHEIVQLPPVPLRIALIGKPFAGKRTIAKRLAAKYCLTILTMDELVQDVIKHADITAKQEESEKSRSKLSNKAQIGAKMQINMLEGGSPDDNLLVSLVVDAIQRSVPEQPGAPYGGFILTDFPRTRAQAQLLEKELSGYEDPKPVKLGNLKRTPKDKTRRRSQIAPLEGLTNSKPGNVVSGLDTVILLDVTNEMACKRAAGRRIDPLTGEMYHLDTNPPPVDQPGLLERLCPLNEDDSESNQIQYQVAAFEEQQDLLKDWFSRFNNMKLVDADHSIPATYDDVADTIQELIIRKAKEKERKEKEALEAAEPLVETAPVPTIETTDQQSDDGQSRSVPAAAVVPDPAGLAATAHAKAPPADTKGAANKKEEEERKGKVGSGRARGASGSVKMAEKTGSRTASAGADGNKARANASAKDRTGAAADGKKERAGTASGERAAAVVADVAAPAATDAPPETTMPVLVRPVGPDGRKLPSRELADVLADQWTTIESTYADTLKFGFRSLRREKEAVLRYFHVTKVNFKRFLERPDTKQQLVELFQDEFNAVEDDLRSDLDAKSELHQRADDLRERLWEMSDKRKDEAEAERLFIIEDKWVEDHFVILVNVYIALMQAEVDRHVGTKQLIYDYFKDAYGTVVVENIKPHAKIPLLSPTAAASIDVSTLVTSGGGDSAQKLHRRDIGGSAEQTRATAGGTATRGGGRPGASSTTAAATTTTLAPGGAGGKRQQPVARMASVVEIPKNTTEKEPLGPENDQSMLADIQSAADAALSVLLAHEETPSPEKEKKDKKKNNQVEPVEQKTEPEPELPQEYHKILEREEQILRRRIDRLKQHAMDNLRELRNKAIDVYTLLDDWISARFAAEMDTIRDMLHVIKEAVEAETRIPNSLILEGERFRIDFHVLTYEPEPEPRPPSPVEKLTPDQFTVLQLSNLNRQFVQVAPQGYISNKEFLDCFQRIASITAGNEPLPEHYLTAETTQMQQLCLSLDPYETGFIFWRKFLLLCARILPVPSADHLIYLRNAYRDDNVSSRELRVTWSDYMHTSLWFEDDIDEASLGDELNPKFNRPAKLKEAIFAIFEVNDKIPSTADSQSQPRTLPSRGSDMTSSNRVIYEEGADGTSSETNVDGNDSSGANNPAPGSAENLTGINQQQKPSASIENLGTNNNPDPRDTRSAAANSSASLANGAREMSATGRMDSANASNEPKEALFDASSFLLSCCVDNVPKVGLQKAFVILSEREDGACTIGQLYQVFHFGLTVLEETHRLAERTIEDPFPIELLSKIFEDANGGPDGVVTFDAFMAAAEPYASIQSCALYQLEDLSIVAGKSRPSSAMEPKSF
ncbi:hypothetical protein DFS34DRAFT_623887 [Phlyctochytrium arcticum]|nr:hypothetical protein DFS34DRAFT_623887 [Phlyctochytrium arcticum]